MSVATPGLILFVFCVIVNMIALITDIFLIKYGFVSITEESRKQGVVSCGIIIWQFLQVLSLIIHIYM